MRPSIVPFRMHILLFRTFCFQTSKNTKEQRDIGSFLSRDPPRRLPNYVLWLAKTVSDHFQGSLQAPCKNDIDSSTIVFFSTPFVRQFNDRTRFLYGVQCPQCFCQHYLLLYSVKWRAEWMTEWPSQENSPRRLDLLGILPNDRYSDCRNPLFFYFTLYQSHGLVANASSGCQ
jgi:hypothetical protein